MDPKVIEKITQKVYARFPEVKGKKPVIKQSKTAANQGDNYVLTYNATAKGIQGNSIPRHVRVVCDARGKIIKMSTSR